MAGEMTDMLRSIESCSRPEPGGPGLIADGDPLTCERVKAAIRAAVGRGGAGADALIVAHGGQSASGHDMGSGSIQPGEPVVIDCGPTTWSRRAMPT